MNCLVRRPGELSNVMQEPPRRRFGGAGAQSIPVYHSYPDKSDFTPTLFLNFGGEDALAVWNLPETFGINEVGGSDQELTQFELDVIELTWRSVAEDYAPFNIDVTTERPDNMLPGRTAAALIGIVPGSQQPRAQLGGFLSSTYGDNYSIVPLSISEVNSTAKQAAAGTALLCSHEIGHQFGLEHQSKWVNGVNVQEYYNGDVPDDGVHTGHGPIMGSPANVGRSNTRGVWWYGTSKVSATTIQDDEAVLASILGYRGQPHNDSIAGSLAASGGEASGTIEAAADKKFFQLTVGGGNRLSLTVTVAAPDAPRGNLLPKIELFRRNGTLMASDAQVLEYTSQEDYRYVASVRATVKPGRYYAAVSSTDAIGTFILNWQANRIS